MKINDKKFLAIFILVVVLSLFYLFQSSYAKYRKQVTGDIQARVANWKIKVNNEDIENKTTLTNRITPILEENEFVSEGVIAPGSTGYFDITINAEEVDVDFNFEITSEVDENTPLLDLIFYKYTINDTEYTFEDTGTLTGTINKNTGDTPIRIYFKWNDDATNQMNNQEDTTYGTTEDYENTNVNVTIHFTQKQS